MNRSAFAMVAAVTTIFTAILFSDNSSSSFVANANSATPVVVELFTSEGCSSCPPADQLLQKFDQQPFPGAQLIVLSEHVDYWNHIGWTDPYSSAVYSQRQSSYGTRLHLDSVYTPQMVVDGSAEFVGSDSNRAAKAIQKASSATKISIKISGVALEGNLLKAHLETGTVARKADVFLVLALDHAESQVAGGENSGRRLTHVAVARNLVKAGSANAGESFAHDVSLEIPKHIDPSQLRLIAFLQESDQGKMLGASLAHLAK